MRVHESARKHGVEPEDALHAAEHAVFVSDLEHDSPARQLRLGFDTAGRLLEVVVLHFDSGYELVIHAMKARQQYIGLLDDRSLLEAGRPGRDPSNIAAQRRANPGGVAASPFLGRPSCSRLDDGSQDCRTGLGISSSRQMSTSRAPSTHRISVRECRDQAASRRSADGRLDLVDPTDLCRAAGDVGHHDLGEAERHLDRQSRSGT